jgi:hypothetical protein
VWEKVFYNLIQNMPSCLSYMSELFLKGRPKTFDFLYAILTNVLVILAFARQFGAAKASCVGAGRVWCMQTRKCQQSAINLLWYAVLFQITNMLLLLVVFTNLCMS